MTGTTEAGFGTSAKRDNLILRDVSRSPFKDPTLVENPAPDQYSPQKFTQQTPTINQPDLVEKTDSFVNHYKRLSKSPQARDVLASVSLDARLSPGPGSYIA